MLITISDKVKFIESVFGSGRLSRNAKNIDVRCPICDPRDHHKKKLSIYVDDDKNHCWTCGWRSKTLAPLIRKYSSHDKFVEYCNKFVPDLERNRYYDAVESGDFKRIELPSDFQLLATTQSVDPDIRSSWRYLIDRGLTERDFWYYKLGVSNEPRWHRRIIVPSFDAQGKLNYFIARAIDKFKKPKYDNSDFDKRSIIFNEINVDWTQRLVICEGVFDMFKCCDNVVPLLGSDINEESTLFNSILVNGTPVAIALDGDMWETKTIKIAKKLDKYGIDVTIVDTRKFGDPGEMSKQQFRDAFFSATTFDWESTFHTRLNRASRSVLTV